MEEEAKPVQKDKTTLRDVGRGFILLGAVILLVTTVFFAMAKIDNKYYGLFSDETHLAFYTISGMVLLGLGLLFVKRTQAKKNDVQ